MAESGDIIWADGEMMLDEEFRLCSMAPGLAVGLGCFETLSAYEGLPVFLGQHLARLRKAAERLDFRLPSDEVLEDAVAEVIGENGLENEKQSRLRITVLALDLDGQASVTISAVPQTAIPDDMAVTVSDYRRNEQGALVGIKTTSYSENTLALREARRAGFDEALLLNSRGDLSEGSLSNVFLIRNGQLLTPELRSGCLPGVTRSHILELAAKLGIPAKEVCIPVHEVFVADEIFLTNSVLGVCPVSRIDQRDLALGPLTQMLQNAYCSLIEDLIQP